MKKAKEEFKDIPIATMDDIGGGSPYGASSVSGTNGFIILGI